jgi:integrase/recombinase XerD
MSELRQALQDYLTVRRALGFKLDRAGQRLSGFIDYLEQAGARTVTIELALAWSHQPPDGHPAWWRQRLILVRGFAKYLHTLDPATQVPPAELLPRGYCRATPYLYSDADIAALLTAARALISPLRAATYETLIGLLAVTGLRVGEAIRLDRGDVDPRNALVTIRASKFGKSREVPLHPSTIDALAGYARRRDQLSPRPSTATFFVSATGTPLIYNCVHSAFLGLVRDAGLQRRSATCRPRPHDLRHTFAVRTLLDWYSAGIDVQARLPQLSTYLGHLDPSSTYWYLSATPELLAIAATRLEHTLGSLP